MRLLGRFLDSKIELLGCNFITILLIFSSAFETFDRQLTYGIFVVSLTTSFFAITWFFFNRSVKIFPLSLMILVAFVYWIIDQLYREVLPLHEQVKICSLFLLFFICSQNCFKGQSLKLFYFICSLAGFCMSLWGIFQYMGIVKIYYRPVLVTGSFENPAGLAVFLSALFPSACFFVKEQDKILKKWGISVCVLIVFVVILSNSRAGIITLFVICTLYYYKYLRVVCGKYWFKKYTFLCVYLIGVLLLLSLYLWKKDSANGRIFIWLCSCKMFLEHWFIGIGGGSFMAKYMLWQAEYFAHNPDSVFGILADEVRHPFNEYLKILVEYGSIGIGIVLCILTNVIEVSKDNRMNQDLLPVFYSLLSIGIFACFSYPLFYLSIDIILILNIAIVASYSKKVWSIGRNMLITWCKSISVLYVFFLFVISVSWFKTEIKWQEIKDLASLGEFEKVLPCYAGMYKQMRHNGMFLYNYGAELYRIGEYESSVKILEECSSYFNNIDLQMLLANNYAQLKMNCEVEKCLKIASDMCPIRYIPSYKLFQFYLEVGDTNRAIEIGNRILNKKIKVESSLIECIKIDVKKNIYNLEGLCTVEHDDFF